MRHSQKSPATSGSQAFRDQLPGSVVFLFQPAEERPPPGEEGGAHLMIEEGALQDPRPEAIFALHEVPQLDKNSCPPRVPQEIG